MTGPALTEGEWQEKAQLLEILVKDIKGTAELLVQRCTALEMYGIDSVQSISVDLSTVALLLAEDAVTVAEWVHRDLAKAAEGFAMMLAEEKARPPYRPPAAQDVRTEVPR